MAGLWEKKNLLGTVLSTSYMLGKYFTTKLYAYVSFII